MSIGSWTVLWIVVLCAVFLWIGPGVVLVGLTRLLVGVFLGLAVIAFALEQAGPALQ